MPEELRNSSTTGPRAGILGLGVSLPERVLTNDDLARLVDTSDEWITSRTGIRERRILEEGRTTSDLAVEAAQRALASAGVCAREVELVIVATCTPDMIFPATASLVQDRIGAPNAGAFDLSAACSGFIYGLAVASQFIATGIYRRVLVVGAEAISRLTDWTDRSTCVLFGDGASAALLGPVDAPGGFLSFALGSDGSGGELLKIEAGGARMPASAATVQERKHYIKMAGTEVFRFAVTVVEDAAIAALHKAQLRKEDVDLFVPHQANIRIIDAAAKRLGIDRARTFSNVHRYGNTSAASVGIALEEAWSSGQLKPDDIVLLVGFGAGLSWASSVLRWTLPAPAADGRGGETQ